MIHNIAKHSYKHLYLADLVAFIGVTQNLWNYLLDRRGEEYRFLSVLERTPKKDFSLLRLTDSGSGDVFSSILEFHPVKCPADTAVQFDLKRKNEPF